MKKRTERRKLTDDLRREYDLSKLKGGVRGKYATRYQAGTNLVLLSPDVAKYFPDEQSVNMALRKLVHVTVTSYPRNRLYHNNGNCTFKDVTGGTTSSTAAAFGSCRPTH